MTNEQKNYVSAILNQCLDHAYRGGDSEIQEQIEEAINILQEDKNGLGTKNKSEVINGRINQGGVDGAGRVERERGQRAGSRGTRGV